MEEEDVLVVVVEEELVEDAVFVEVAGSEVVSTDDAEDVGVSVGCEVLEDAVLL